MSGAGDWVQSLNDESSEQETDISDAELSETNTTEKLAAENIDLLIEEDEVHLQEDEDDLKTWSQNVEDFSTSDQFIGVMDANSE